jgi:PAS domain S-box-containing protein
MALYDGLRSGSPRVWEDGGPAGRGQPLFQVGRWVHVGGRELRLELSSTAAYESGIARTDERLTAAAGATLSLAMAVLVGWLAGGGSRRPPWGGGPSRRRDHAARRSGRPLGESEAMLDRAGRVAGVGGWELDLETHVIRWTAQTCRIHGVPPSYQTTARAVAEFYPPAAWERIQTLARGCARHGTPWDEEMLLRRRDGRPVWVRSLGEARRDEHGRIVGLAGAVQDVSDERALRYELYRSERFMRLVTDQIPGVVSYWTPSLRCTFANQAHLGWTGRTPQQMQGISLRDLLGPERFALDEPPMRAALRGQPQRLERSRVRPDGSVAQYWLHYLPDWDGTQVQGVVVVGVDVT